MSEYKTNKERILELQNKIHELRMKKLLTIEYIEEETHKLIVILTELDKKLSDISDKLVEGKMEEKMAYAIIKSIEARKSILDGWKMALKECRLALTFLVKEEGKVQYLLVEASSG